MQKLVCPHCDSQVSERANVCVGCGAEIVRGATRRERTNVGCAFAFLALLVGLVAMGASLLPAPNSDSALFVVLGLSGFVFFGSLVGNALARLFHRSKLRFFRTYDHQ
jgi:hypothetical protein